MKAQVLFDSCNFSLTGDSETRDRVLLNEYIESAVSGTQYGLNRLSDKYIKSVKDTFINHALASLIGLDWCTTSQKLPTSKIAHTTKLEFGLCEKWTIILHQLSKTEKYVLIYIDAMMSDKITGELHMCFDGSRDVLDSILEKLNLQHEVCYIQE